MRTVIALVVALLLAAAAGAQTVYNPKVIQFDSPDHATACPGTSCVSAYKVEYWLPGVDPATGQPVSTYDLPKTAVAANPAAPPAYQAQLTALTPLPAVPVGTTYVARMVAVGNDATLLSARSVASNPFVYPAAPRSPAAVSLK